MQEMMETATILEQATENSLVVIDELGRGTSTTDGFGLAWSISQELNQRGTFTMFATHFHELTRIAGESGGAGVQNLHAAALVTESDIVLLYKIRPGACMDSYGLHCAKMAAFPTSVIDDARQKLTELE